MAKIDVEGLEQNEDRLISVDDSGYCLMANPKKSYGYLYITVLKQSE